MALKNAREKERGRADAKALKSRAPLSRGKQHIRRISAPLSLFLRLLLRDSLTNSRFIALFIVPPAEPRELYPTSDVTSTDTRIQACPRVSTQAYSRTRSVPSPSLPLFSPPLVCSIFISVSFFAEVIDGFLPYEISGSPYEFIASSSTCFISYCS